MSVALPAGAVGRGRSVAASRTATVDALLFASVFTITDTTVATTVMRALARKWPTSSGTSSVRSRSGGRRIGTTFKR